MNAFGLRQLKRYSRLAFRIFGISLIPPFCLLLSSYYLTVHYEKQTVKAASELNARQMRNLVRAVEITLGELEIYLRNTGFDDDDNWRILQYVVYDDPRFREVGVVDEQGFLTLTSLGPVEPPIKLNPETRADLSRKELQIIGPLTTAIMKERSLVFVLPMTGESEINILIDPIFLDYLLRLDGLDLGPDGYIAYVRNEDQKILSGIGLLPRDGNLLSTEFDRSRFKFFHPIKDTDITIVTNISRSWMLRHWKKSLIAAIPIALMAGVAITGLLFRLAFFNNSIAHDIRVGLRNHEFELHYQPIFDIRTGVCVGSEALLRWRHPERGLLFPNEFIPVAERTQQINAIGEWIIERVIKDYKTLLKKYPTLYASINLSPSQMTLDSQSDAIFKLLENHQDIFPNLVFEVTETVFIEDAQTNVYKTIAKIRSLGAKVALDDFGTGHSGISYLSKFHVDCLKIDRRFVAESESDSNLAVILESIISLGQRLQTILIAEGIETDSQRQTLVQKGVCYGQGWLLARPMPFHEFEIFLDAR